MLFLSQHTSNIHFKKRQNLKRALPQVRGAFRKTLPNIQCPNKLPTPTTPQEKATLKELNNKLGFVRKFIETLFPDGGIPEYFRGQIGIVKAFKVAHCDEFAEITKTALTINGIKNADIFQLYAKNPNSHDAPRPLDHALTAIGVKKRLNNKKNPRPFIPGHGTKIFDMYLDGYIGTVKGAQKKYRVFGLKPGEILMLKPVKTYEHTPESISVVKKNFPFLLIKG